MQIGTVVQTEADDDWQVSIQGNAVPFVRELHWNIDSEPEHGMLVAVVISDVGEILSIHHAAKAQKPKRRANFKQSKYPSNELTAAELIVAELAITGATYKDIARTLKRSPSTIRNQLHSIYSKLGVKSKAALAYVMSKK